MDLTTISAAVSSLRAATDIAKFIKESDFSLEKAELKLKLADLLNALADTRIELAELQEEAARREQEIRDLKAALQGATELTFLENVYWRVEVGGKRDGPFCQRCYDVDAKRVRLQPAVNGPGWYCRQCKSGFSR